jgi:polyisoprenoid-binding protein YceI
MDQRNPGRAAATSGGTGMDQSSPSTLKKMTGTQIQWMSSFAPSWWLSPYSANHWSADFPGGFMEKILPAGPSGASLSVPVPGGNRLAPKVGFAVCNGSRTLSTMRSFRRFALLSLLPLLLAAAERPLKIDRGRSFLDVDVDATKNFTSHLDAYEAVVQVDDAGKIKGAVFTFNFDDLKSGNGTRDADMIKWLGGGSPGGKFELGNLAVTPDGQGQASGRLTFHGATQRIEFPINITKDGDGAYTITGETTIDYHNWNLKTIRKALLFTVSPEVKIRFKLTGTPVTEAGR